MNDYKILLIDLENKKYEIKKINEKSKDKYIGGYAMGLYFFKNFTDLKKEPFGIFSSVFKDIETVGRASIISYNDKLTSSSIGGDFENHLNDLGLDAIVLLNKSNDITSIEVSKDKVIFYPADEIKNYDNGKTFNYFNEKYNGSSSIYVTKSAFNNNFSARLINDKYYGIAKGLGYFFYKKNLKSLTLNSKKSFRNIGFNGKKGVINCPNCPIGCRNHFKVERPTVFDLSDRKSASILKKDIDNYGIDLIALSKSIEFAKKYLNDIYNFKNLDYDTLSFVIEKIKENDDKYSNLCNGVGYLVEKYSIDLKTKDHNKRKIKDISKVADTLGICLFAFEEYDLDYIRDFVNEYSNLNLNEKSLENLIFDIKKLEDSL